MSRKSTPKATKSADRIDPIRYEMFVHRLMNIAEELQERLTRVARRTDGVVLHERHV